MFKNILERISGVEVFPLISLLLFRVIFTLVLIWTFRMDKKKIKYMENLPLNDDENLKNK